MRKTVKEILKRRRPTNWLIENYGRRTMALSVLSFLTGSVYAVFCFIMGILSGSLWYGALACYYVLLGIMRGVVLANAYKVHRSAAPEGGLSENRLCLDCGVLFIAMIVFLSAMILLIVRRDKTFAFSATRVYIFAGYTFYRIGMAIYNFFTVRNRSGYGVLTLRCINLVAALVSFLTLQSAALVLFSKNLDHAVMNAITGMVVCALVLAVDIFMIVYAVRHTRVLRS